MNLPGVWVDRAHKQKLLKQVILDMDSSVSPTHGNQEGSAYNGYFERTCYHPLFCFNQFGDMEPVLLRGMPIALMRSKIPKETLNGSNFSVILLL